MTINSCSCIMFQVIFQLLLFDIKENIYKCTLVLCLKKFYFLSVTIYIILVILT